jgi:hypothetical protein
MRVSLCGVLVAAMLLMPVTASAGDRLKPWRVAAIVGCGVADALTTVSAINRGAHEANPVWRPLVGRPHVFIPARISMGMVIAWGNEKAPTSNGDKNVLAALVTGLHCGAAVWNSTRLR